MLHQFTTSGHQLCKAAKKGMPQYQQPGNGKKLGDQNGSDTKATTGETTPCREKQTVGGRKVPNAHMDNQKPQNTENQEERLGRNSH